MPLIESQQSFSENPESFSVLFAEHHRRVLLAAYRVTGNMADAEDVTQAVFLRLASAIEPPENASTISIAQASTARWTCCGAGAARQPSRWMRPRR